MRFFNAGGLVLTLALSQICYSLKATILADTNRDGTVDVEGDSDTDDKNIWTENRGAIFLANIGDTNQRCSRKITADTADDDLDKCHDASDNTQRNPKYLAHLRTIPNTSLDADAVGSIHVTGQVAADMVRIFAKAGPQWTYVNSNYTFTARELAEGLQLGIDSRDVRRPTWDGKATIHFTIKSGEETATDSVMLRVAPIMTHHHLQQAERVFVTNYSTPMQIRFVSDLEVHVADAGIEDLFYFETDDIWTQDFFEPGYTSMPGPEGPVVLRIMVRSSQNDRPAGRQIFTKLRSDKVGAVQFLSEGGTIDSMGNLETIPPYRHNGKHYPAGRIIMGRAGGQLPNIFPFLQAQEIQDPLELDTGWLLVSHVDEFIQFLPAKSERGWIMMVDDPHAGLEILRKASKEGHGDTRAMSRPHFQSDEGRCLPSGTIDEKLKQENLTALNDAAAGRIKANIDILKRETGITDKEILRVPALFYYDEGTGCNNTAQTTKNAPGKLASRARKVVLSNLEAAERGLKVKRRDIPELQGMIANYPGAINGIVLSDSYYLAPNPWGPIINGTDGLTEAVTEVYTKAMYNVTFMDDWFSHHVGQGEVHCGSNTWRSADHPWW
ncbi:hypothetical protein NM208_g1260 [Fusarium decemcellulare]|uniref:Uncharacterized protein n=1 Tax=Fusarium decemcellulare TaxID=57161 RepID=A0ACC1SWY8_9HYPO|nr:hypothetical protein NM208_g1260 [Fusarium decemcellulare]